MARNLLGLDNANGQQHWGYPGRVQSMYTIPVSMLQRQSTSLKLPGVPSISGILGCPGKGGGILDIL